MLFVTGITGHSGRYFLKHLIQNGYDAPVRLLVRSKEKLEAIHSLPKGFEVYEGAIEDTNLLNVCMENTDVVLHIAGITKSINIIKAALDACVKKVFLVHTTGIYSQFKSAADDYLNIENQIINIVKNSNNPIEVIILRPTMIYGDLCDLNMSKFIKLVDALPFIPVVNHGQGLIQPVNARDLGKGYYQAISSQTLSKNDYILSGERPITLKDALTQISKCLGKEQHFISLPSGLSIFGAKVLKLITLGKVDFVEKVQRMTESRAFPHDIATRDFGFTPMSFEEGIAIEVEQYMVNKGRAN